MTRLGIASLDGVRIPQRHFGYAVRRVWKCYDGSAKSGLAVHRYQVLEVSDEASRRHVVLWVSEERTSEGRRYRAYGDEPKKT